jgi:hypothetical protein
VVDKITITCYAIYSSKVFDVRYLILYLLYSMRCSDLYDIKEDMTMEKQHEHRPSPEEVVEAERRLTPEQAVGSRARYSILKNQEILEGVGVSDEQIKEAATLASEQAVAEFNELEQREPWHRTMSIVESAKPRLSEDEQLLLDGHVNWSKDFVSQWKDKLDWAKNLWGKDLSTQELVRRLNIQSLHPHMMRQFGDPVQDYPSIMLMSPKVRCLVDPESEKQRQEKIEKDKWRPVTEHQVPPREIPEYDRVLKPSEEGIEQVFKSFGAEVPQGEDRKEEKLIPTQFDGIFLVLSGQRRDVVSLSFDLKTLDAMLTANKELENTTAEE